MSPFGDRLRLPLPQARPCFRCREREPGRLQLRVVLPDETVIDVRVEEDADRIEVLVLVLREYDRPGKAVDCPVPLYLDAALGDRLVTDAARDGAPVERFVPDW